jgi:hypothetical protein
VYRIECSEGDDDLDEWTDVVECFHEDCAEAIRERRSTLLVALDVLEDAGITNTVLHMKCRKPNAIDHIIHVKWWRRHAPHLLVIRRHVHRCGEIIGAVECPMCATKFAEFPGAFRNCESIGHFARRRPGSDECRLDQGHAGPCVA